MKRPTAWIHALEVGAFAPDAGAATTLVHAFADSHADRTRLAEELHQLACTTVGAVEVAGRRVLVMASSRHDVEVRHVRALRATAGPITRSRVDRVAYRRRLRARARRRRR